MLTIRGGRLVTAAGEQEADLTVSQGLVAAVGPGVAAEDGEVVDASGLLVVPGMVDSHVHLMDPGSTHREDFPSGSRAAAARGVTTIVEHTHAHPVRSPEDLMAKRSHLAGRSNVDFALAAHVWPEDVDTLAATWRAGVAFFKLFTCTTHGVPGLNAADVEAAFTVIAQAGGRALVHSEDESLTARAEQLLRSEGRTDPALLSRWRSREAELVATAAVGVLAAATGVTATVAHVSHPTAAEVVAGWRGRGADLVAEICPQYLAFDEGDVDTEGAFRKFTPPARIRSPGEREAMWKAVTGGLYSHFSSDHAPSTRQQKLEGDIWTAPFGLPGLDTTFPFVIDAVLSGRLSPTAAIRLTSANVARRLGLFPRKGALEVGSDADIVLIDPDRTWTVTDEAVLSKAGWTPMAGRTLRGRVVATYLRGRLVAEDGRALDERTGTFVAGAGATE